MAALVAAVLAPGPTAAPAAAASSAVSDLVPGQGRLFGAFVDPGASPTMPASADGDTAVEAFETRVGRKLDLRRLYLRWDDQIAQPTVLTDVHRGRTPILSVRAQRRDGTKLAWARIAAGAYDADIAAQARAVADLGVPVFLAFHHEPDASTGYGTPAEFAAAWRRYVQVFSEQGVANAAFTWVMTPSSFGSGYVGAGADAYYPGDDVVDWLALDAYNWYGCAPSKPTSWRPLAQVVGPFRTWAARHAKPLMLAEWGSAEDPADPTRKAAWLREAASALDAWPEVKAVSYFHSLGTCPWWVDSSAPSERAFADIAAAPSAHGRTTASLDVSTERGAAPLPVVFDASASAGAGQASGQGVAAWTVSFGDGTPDAAGTGTPPADLRHTFGAGTRTVRLTVTDAAGRTASDVRTVVSAAPPTIPGASSTVTGDTTAALKAWVGSQGFAADVTFEYGTTTAYGSRVSTSLPARDWTQAVSVTLTGLAPGTRYYWRVVAASEAGTTTSASRSLDTTGPPTPVLDATTQVTSGTALLNAHVHPHSLDTTLWFELAPVTEGAATVRTVPVAVAAHTGYRWVSVPVAGLAAGTRYSVQAVATNASGTGRSTPGTFTTGR